MTLTKYFPKEDTEFYCEAAGFTVLSPEIPLYHAADADARIAELEQDQRARIEALHTLRMGYDATVAQLEAQVATVRQERDALSGSNDAVRQERDTLRHAQRNLADKYNNLRQELAKRDTMIQWLDTRSMNLEAEITTLKKEAQR